MIVCQKERGGKCKDTDRSVKGRDSSPTFELRVWSGSSPLRAFMPSCARVCVFE